MKKQQKAQVGEFPSKQKRMRGVNFKQSSLCPQLDGMSFGQKNWSQFIVLLLLTFLAFLSARLVGQFMGSISGLATLGLGYYSIGICVAVPLLVWTISVFFRDFIQSFAIAFLAFVSIFILLFVLDYFEIFEIVPNRLLIALDEESMSYADNFLFESVIPSIVVLIGGMLCFHTNRLVLATINLLLVDRWKILFSSFVTVLAVFWAFFIGGINGFAVIVEQIRPIIENLEGWEYLASSQAQISRSAALLISTSYGVVLWMAAWHVNRRRNVPWEHPDLFRNLALILGSWRGTSFHKLDLSGVSFRGAHLANTDLRAQKLYRTCFQEATGLERARVDSRYLDLEVPKVQKLLTYGTSQEIDYDRLSLRGAYLHGADLRRMSLIDTDLSGADLNNADLRGAILARTQVIGADFSNANLTGICIQDWSVNSETDFSNVLCDYVYRELDERGEPVDRYPADRNFEPQEFESLYQEIGNVAELVFKEGVNWRAFSFSMQKLDLEDDGLGLELKGFERRGDRWVVRVTHNQHVPKQEVESRLLAMYDDMKGLLAAKEDQIHQLLGIASDQAESIKELSQKPFGNSFFITGSTITNLTGSGNIEYTEVASQVREIITHGSDRQQAAPFVRQFVQQLKQQDVAVTGATQLELMEQLMISEAEADPSFRAYLLQESPQILQAMAGTPLTQVIERAIAQLRQDQKSNFRV